MHNSVTNGASSNDQNKINFGSSPGINSTSRLVSGRESAHRIDKIGRN